MTADSFCHMPRVSTLVVMAAVLFSGSRAVAVTLADNLWSTGTESAGPTSSSAAPDSRVVAEEAASARENLPAQATPTESSDMDADAVADGKADMAPPARVWDPWESYNRAMFHFNDGLYAFAFRPFTHAYERVVPRTIRHGIANAFENLRFPIRLVSCLLQGRLGGAGKETAKFGINTVLGVGGLGRASDKFPGLADLPAEDIGLALGTWGITPGPYLVLPILGPGDVRDDFGEAGDFFLNPVNWDTIHLGHITWISNPYRFPVQSLEFASAIPNAIHRYDAVAADAVDPYIAVREAYFSHRRAEGAR